MDTVDQPSVRPEQAVRANTTAVHGQIGERLALTQKGARECPGVVAHWHKSLAAKHISSRAGGTEVDVVLERVGRRLVKRHQLQLVGVADVAAPFAGEHGVSAAPSFAIDGTGAIHNDPIGRYSRAVSKGEA